MRLSRSFLPVLKESPSDAQIVSHKLMLRAGLVRQTAAGIYAWLPLGFRVLKKIEQIVREEQDRAGAIELLMPTLQSADLWRQSGRYDAYGPEMLRIKDRHEREMLYGPTNEEMITDIFQGRRQELPRPAAHPLPHPVEVPRRGPPALRRDARPRIPDEGRLFVRPRRGRRAATAITPSCWPISAPSSAWASSAVPMKAASGPDRRRPFSHEFIVLAPTGESEVFYDAAFEEFDWAQADLRYDDAAGLQALFDKVSSTYSATDETHDEARWADVPADRQRQGRGIEVGHIFYFGTKYSASMGLKVSGPDGSMVTPEMGSYGVGVSRLVGAIIEASHDDNGIIWPEAVAPWKVGLVTMRGDDAASVAAADDIYAKLTAAGVEVLYDDRDERGGAKLGWMDLIGLPWQLIIGPRGLAQGVVELKNRRTGEKQELRIESALEQLTA